MKAREEFELDIVVVIPSKFPPGKRPAAPFEKRFHWTQKVFGSLPWIQVSDLEAKSTQTVFAKEIFSQWAVKSPEAQYFWILGEDNWERLSFWRDIDDYGHELIWLVMPRSEAAKPGGLLSRRLQKSTCAFYWTKALPMVEVASHLIRENLDEASLRQVPLVIRSDVESTYKGLKAQGEAKT